jgi:nucleoside-diphosphate-sugar epimerase
MKVLIVGCGYIGTATAKLWKKKNYHITGTVKTAEKVPTLTQVVNRCLIMKGDDEEELVPLIAEHDLILVCLASKDPEQYENTYLQTSQFFKKLALEMDMPRHLIYTGSTSVYGDHHGQWVDESSELKSDTEQGKILIETEKNFLSLAHVGWTCSVLRLSEIYGPERELSHRVKMGGKQKLPGTGEQYTNMVHQTDCVQAIDYAYRHKLEGIFNVTDDEHPTRKDLYDAVSHKFHLPKVQWDPTHPSLHGGNKRVSNHKIKTAGFTLHYPHRILD